MTATATAGAFNDPPEEERGPSWFSWLPGGKKPKQTNNYGAEATPNRMATYIGVALGVVFYSAAWATGLSWLLLLAGGSPIAGIVIDKSQSQKQEQVDAKKIQKNSAELVEDSNKISDELNPQNPNNQPLLLKENFFKNPPKEYMDLLHSLSLSNEQIGILYNNLPEKASSQDFYQLTQSFLAEQENQQLTAPETDKDQPPEVKDEHVVQEIKENLAEEKEPTAIFTHPEGTVEPLSPEETAQNAVLRERLEALRDKTNLRDD
ncbi:MAG: hypothetical protein ACK5UY_01515 [Holosporales bacterium]